MKETSRTLRLAMWTLLTGAAVLTVGAFAVTSHAQSVTSSSTNTQMPAGFNYPTGAVPIGASSVVTTNTNGTATTNATGTMTSTTGAPVLTAAPGTAPAPMVAQVDENGNALVRGVVQSVNTNWITIASWGGTWNVRTTGNSTVTPVGTNGGGDVSGITPGDFVGVEGTVASDQVWTVNASVVRDWTKAPATTALSTTDTSTSGSLTGSGTSVATPPDNSSTASTTGLPSGDTLYTGTASNVTSSSFTLTDQSGNAYTVNTNPDATIWDSSSNTIPLTNIQNGDTIRVDASQNGNTLTADVVRDTSL